MKIGDVIQVEVTNVQNYGAYVVAQDQQIGFIDWCEFSWIQYKCDPRMPQDLLAIGQMIDVKVYGFRSDGNFSASIKRLNEDADPWLKMTPEQVGKTVEGEILTVGEWGLVVRHPFNVSVSCPYQNEQSQSNYTAGESVTIEIEMVDPDRGVLGKVK